MVDRFNASGGRCPPHSVYPAPARRNGASKRSTRSAGAATARGATEALAATTHSDRRPRLSRAPTVRSGALSTVQSRSSGSTVLGVSWQFARQSLECRLRQDVVAAAWDNQE